MSKWRALVEEVNHRKIARDHLQSQYLLNSNDMTEESKEINMPFLFGLNVRMDTSSTYSHCDISTCESMYHIVEALKKYHVDINGFKDKREKQLVHDDNKSEVCETKQEPNMINVGQYDMVLLLNYLHHLMKNHKSETEEIYDILRNHIYNGKKCDLANCLMLSRNRRDRVKLGGQDSAVYKLYFYQIDVNDITIQQIMDSIHCYYLHSLDIGYKLTKKDKQQILNGAKDYDEKSIESTDYSTNYIRKSLHNIINKKKHLVRDTTKFSDELVPKNAYSFGFRFFYWSYYKNNANTIDEFWLDRWDTNDQVTNKGYSLAHFYVTPKYKDLKDEMTNNPICKISIIQFNHTYGKAEIHLKSNFYKGKKCNLLDLHTSSDCYDGATNLPISINHLIAMMIHCNFDILNAKFCDSCRMDENHDIDGLITKHSNFAHLGRLLRECVDLYGTEIRVISRLYYGINNCMEFKASNARIKGPISTTTEYTVAVNFASSNGMILELFNAPQSTRALGTCSSFACQFLSDFKNEQEVFFVGGTQRFIILDIIDASSTSSYGIYINALANIDKYLQQNEYQAKYGLPEKKFLGDKRVNMPIFEQAAFRMFLHELSRYYPEKYQPWQSLPKYAENLLHNQFLSTHHICFGLYWMINNYVKCLYHFFCYDYGWVKIDVLTTVFPNLKRIAISNVSGQNNLKLIKNTSVFTSVLSQIRRGQISNLDEIRIYVKESQFEQAGEVIKLWEDQFGEVNWSVYTWKEGRAPCVVMESLFSSRRCSQMVELLFQQQVTMAESESAINHNQS
eukprot:188546_1